MPIEIMPLKDFLIANQSFRNILWKNVTSLNSWNRSHTTSYPKLLKHI